jgi:hypothetical protein
MDSTEKMSPFPHLKMKTDPVSKTFSFEYLQFRMTDEVHKPSDSQENYCSRSLSYYKVRTTPLQPSVKGNRKEQNGIFDFSKGLTTGSQSPFIPVHSA